MAEQVRYEPAPYDELSEDDVYALQVQNNIMREALEMALPWMNGLVRDIYERGRWTKELADDCWATRDAVKAALEASDG